MERHREVDQNSVTYGLGVLWLMKFPHTISSAFGIILIVGGCVTLPNAQTFSDALLAPRKAPSDLLFIFKSVKERTPASAVPQYVPNCAEGEVTKWRNISAEYWKTALTIFGDPVQNHLRRYVEFYCLTNAIPALMEQLEYDDDPICKRTAVETLLILDDRITISEGALQPLYENLSDGGYDVAPERERFPGLLSDYDNWRSLKISQALKNRAKANAAK